MRGRGHTLADKIGREEVDGILKYVAGQFQIGVIDLMCGKPGGRENLRAKRVAAFLIRANSNLTYREIGRRLGYSGESRVHEHQLRVVALDGEWTMRRWNIRYRRHWLTLQENKP